MTLLAQHLDRSRYVPVVVFVNETPHAAALRAAGVSVFVLEDPVYSRTASQYGRRMRLGMRTAAAWMVPRAVASADAFMHRRTLRALERLFVRERVALLHCNDQSVRDWYGIVAARHAGIPVVSHLRSVRMGGIPPSFAAAIVDTVTQFIANSRYTADVWQAALHMPPARMTVIPNALALHPACPVDIRREQGIPAGVPLIGCIGNFMAGKGQEHLVAALVRIRAQRPDAHCIFIGDGPLRAAVEQRVDALGLRNAVRFTGYDSRVRGIAAACDVLVVPSDTETFGRAILEGYAARCPVVATGVGGIPEVLTDGVTGLLVPPADPQSLGNAILRFLADSGLVARCIAAGYDTCVQRYAVAPHVAAVSEVYDAIFAPHGTSV